METGKLIKELRIKKGITQEELADLTELSARTIQRIENGEVDPRAYTLQVIAKALEVDFSIFTENESGEDFMNETKRYWLVLIHLSGLLPLFIPSVIIWNRKKDEIKELTKHFHAVIAFQSTIFLLCTLSLWVFYSSKSPRVFIAILLLSVFLSVRNTLYVLNGRPYKYYGLFKTKKPGKNLLEKS